VTIYERRGPYRKHKDKAETITSLARHQKRDKVVEEVSHGLRLPLFAFALLHEFQYDPIAADQTEHNSVDDPLSNRGIRFEEKTFHQWERGEGAAVAWQELVPWTVEEEVEMLLFLPMLPRHYLSRFRCLEDLMIRRGMNCGLE
jgi:hypothetical protein